MARREPLFLTLEQSRKLTTQRVNDARESRANLSSDDNRVREWRPLGERLYPAFALQLHITPKAGVMVWGVIAYNTGSPSSIDSWTMTVQWYVNDILQPNV
ncbi:transposable element Tcb2 transposase [Trichonephila clavipes]|nr:transposable element Tcb2 transposase [Trichonephila clavipes]